MRFKIGNYKSNHKFQKKTIRIIRSFFYSNYLNTKFDIRFSSSYDAITTGCYDALTTGCYGALTTGCYDALTTGCYGALTTECYDALLKLNNYRNKLILI